MAQEDLFDLNIPATDLQAVQDAVQTLVTTLAPPHLSSLSAEDRRTLPKMGDKSLAFVRKAREYAHSQSGGTCITRAVAPSKARRRGKKAPIPP